MIERIRKGIIRRLKKAVIIIYCFLSGDRERKEIAGFLLRIRGMAMYPYDYTKKYDQKTIEVLRDAEGYPFVMHCGKRMYLKKSWSREKCQRYYNNLRIEQDRECTHRYFTDPGRYPDKDDIVADLGAAEGIFGLDVIDGVCRLYLFEGDEDWIVPLSKTFMPWGDKAVIVNKYVSDQTGDRCISLDDYFVDGDVTYIKADIEGAEGKMLKGAGRSLNSGIKKALICVYHRTGDEDRLKKIMEDHGFGVEINPGYLVMTNPDSLLKDQYLRHGVLFARRKRVRD